MLTGVIILGNDSFTPDDCYGNISTILSEAVWDNSFQQVSIFHELIKVTDIYSKST